MKEIRHHQCCNQQSIQSCTLLRARELRQGSSQAVCSEYFNTRPACQYKANAREITGTKSKTKGKELKKKEAMLVDPFGSKT